MVLSYRALAVTVLALGLTLGAPAVASADARFQSLDHFSGPEGAGITMIRSVASDDGTVVYEMVTYFAGPHGAGMSRTFSSAS
ncbi:hypothetical protein [Nocardiopsis sp. CA-288880]|uniref:hypothetical protein n=1 Tax=Nocardiopsis sp. CA-288880 TaxID=3239995 RepID=UPI003D993474